MPVTIDPKNELTNGVLLYAADQAAGTANSSGLDLKAGNYIGQLAVFFNCGPKTAGDAHPTWDGYLITSHDSNVSNGVNVDDGAITQVTNANNQQVVLADTRALRRYLFARSVVAGTNGIIPRSVTFVGQTKVEP